MLFSDWDTWNLAPAILPLLTIAVSFAWATYILAYPPVYKKLSIVLLGIPVAYAFIYHVAIMPDSMLSDTIGRFMYMWYAHMSYEVIILEFKPTVEKGNLEWKSRIHQAYRVIWDRNHAPFVENRTLVGENKRRDSAQDSVDVLGTAPQPSTISTTTVTKRGKGTKHGYSYARFTLHHALQLIFLLIAIILNDQFRSSDYAPSVSFSLDPSTGSFFRRLPASLNRGELFYRAQCCWDWTVISMFEYETYYSLCALIFVSVLRFDAPSDWPLSLCGHLSEAWSIRQYWGKHWHNYIYYSFTAHTRILTRSWMGLRRGRWTTRFLENLIVFAVSGFMHTVVRWVQSPGGYSWPITFWYIGQMLPIVLESAVQHYWHMVRQRFDTDKYGKCLAALESAVGYAWVAGWFMWSVPKYSAAGAKWRMSMFEREMGHPI